jgi:O-antigen/teichoic acid export membrane protein
LIGYILLTGTYFVSALIQFSNKRTFLAYSLIIPTIVNLGLNRALIPLYGLTGSMYATMAAYGLYFGGLLWYNKRLIRRNTYRVVTRATEMGETAPQKQPVMGKNQTLSNVLVASSNTKQRSEHFES